MPSIGRECLIGACALIPEGKVIPDRSLVMGTPGKVIRTLTDDGGRRNTRQCATATSPMPAAIWSELRARDGRRRPASESAGGVWRI